MEKVSELQMGHNSQHENGELREPIKYIWEDLGYVNGKGDMDPMDGHMCLRKLLAGEMLQLVQWPKVPKLTVVPKIQ